MSRRTRGTGTIAKAKDHKGRLVYRGAVELAPDAEGKRHRKWFTARTQREVEELIAEWRERQREGERLPAGELTLGRYLRHWLAGRDNVSDSTIERYEQAIKRLPPETLGIRLDRLEPEDLERAYQKLRAQGMAPAGRRKVHSVLHAALKRAVMRRYLTYNPAEMVDPPRVPKTEVQTIPASEVLALLGAARGDRYEALYWLACSTGMREGELLGLRWVDIDWQAPAVMVRGNLRYSAEGGLKRRETKTRRQRRIDLAPSVVAALRAHQARQEEDRRFAGPHWEDSGLVFALPTGGPCRNSWFLRSSWYRVRAKAGLPETLNFKDASRHAAATLLIAAGVQQRIVADILGHTTLALTERYGHVLPGMQAGAVDAMERLLSGS